MESCHACAVHFWYVLNTTAYHLGRYEPSSSSTKELHSLSYNMWFGNLILRVAKKQSGLRGLSFELPRVQSPVNRRKISVEKNEDWLNRAKDLCSEKTITYNKLFTLQKSRQNLPRQDAKCRYQDKFVLNKLYLYERKCVVNNFEANW